MKLTTEQKNSLEQEIETFKHFNAERMKIWKPKPIIGAMICADKFMGFGVRFYEKMFETPEYVGQGYTFHPIREIK